MIPVSHRILTSSINLIDCPALKLVVLLLSCQMWLFASFVRFVLVGQHHSSLCEGLGIHYPIQSFASVARQEHNRIQEPASITSERHTDMMPFTC